MRVKLDYASPENLKVHHEALWYIVNSCNNDFIPTLTEREIQLPEHQEIENTEGKPHRYFHSILDRHYVLIYVNEVLAGFSCFSHKHIQTGLEFLGESNYISPTCIHKDYRGLGLATHLYNYLEHDIPTHLKLPLITRATWSLNYAQMHLFTKMGYTEVHRIPNNRGQNIDSIYYAKTLDIKVPLKYKGE